MTARSPLSSGRYWLMKTEPRTYGFDDLWRAPGRTTTWDGTRNYQVRNFMRDEMHVGDGVLIYHSSADPTGVAGVAEIASAAYADETAFDPDDSHFDPKSRRDAPTWLAVDVRATARLPRFVSLDVMKGEPALADMAALRRGNRLSVTPVTAAEWAAIRRLGGLR